ncbi:HNH endonuclease [Mycobacterium sp. NAZ190054]|uniref:HNH endonuclease n=1 Tax=Mycobacterium sp. NAZ190054 TaxID=1747766 RepID=UPI0007970921|nr:HNH endonuclease [Mycobacterium sp. NAZ190054]KWX61377.1 HNH endonuclease [Mycobacterium sp. NAZ190054]
MSAICVGCGVGIRGRQRRVYCTNACQQAHRRRLLLETWLATGVCGRTSYQGHYVRDYLYEQQGRRCAICAISDSWNGQTLGLILDHIDGDPSNDRRENLRLICPNCDSQLPTYKARNRGSGRYYRRQRYMDGLSY